MNMIYKIARAEIRNLFYSPIAWLIILVFYIVCSFQFVSPLVDGARIQEANLESNPLWEGFPSALSVGIFIDSIKKILENFYLFIPLLTMGVINREVNNGTIKLLYSSPIRIRDIVLGKYLGLVIFSLLLLIIVAVLFITGYCTIIHAEYKWYLAILLSLFLLTAAYIAIGMFLSSLTSYPIVAGILTFVVFFVLQELRDVWQQYDFFRDITYFLAMTNKAERIIQGLITTRDVLYFIIIIMTFLIFTLIKLKSTQESRSWKVSFVRYFFVAIVMLTAGYFSSRPGYVGYMDVTRNKVNTIHPAMQATLKELDGSPLTVTLYTNILGRTPSIGLPQNRNNYIWEFWEKFVEFYPNIKYKYEYFYDINDKNKDILSVFPGKSVKEVAEGMAKLFNTDLSRFKKPEEIRKLVNLKDEDMGLIMELEYKGKKEFFRTYPDTKVLPEQQHLCGSIRRLARGEAPKIYFTTGHYERSPYRNGEREYGYNTNYKGSRIALINLGVDVDTISLLHRDIPADADVLVVADPKSSIDTTEKRKIVEHINRGGNLIVYGEPGKQGILNPLLDHLGVILENGVLVIPSKQDLPNTFTATLTTVGKQMADEYPLVNARRKNIQAGIYISGAAAIGYRRMDDFKVEPIYGAFHRNGWIENGLFRADSAAPVFSAAEGDIKKDSFVIGVQLTRTIKNRQQRIMISGDADFMTPKRVWGADIQNGMFSWLLYNTYPVYANYADPVDVKLKIGFNNAQILYAIYIYVISACIVFCATLLLIRRKRK